MGERNRTRPWLGLSPADVVLACCLAGISVLVAAHAGDNTPGSVTPNTWWEWLIVVLPPAAVAFRSSAPMTAAPIAVIGQMLIWFFGLAEVFVAPLVMIYSVAALGGRRGLRMAIACSAALSAMAGIGVAVAPDVNAGTFLLTILSSAVVVILGMNAARTRKESAELAARLAVSELEGESARERAVMRERERIAHELHDLVGHSLSVIAIQAQAAERIGRKRPDEALDVVSSIGDTARQSLAEVRRVLHAMHGENDPELAPVPSLDDLDELVDRVASSGVDVELRRTDRLDDLSIDAAAGAGAYRIVQEALTNVIKHAGPAARASVVVDVDDENMVVSVTDDGRGMRLDGPTTGGLGLAGMTERAEFLGGTLDAGPAAGGGFQVRARIPLERMTTA